MKLKVCEYCGTEYDRSLDKCPLCGKGQGDEIPVTPAAASQDRIPQWMWILTCVLLALAVVVGFVYFLVSMEYVGKKDNVEPVISAPMIEEPVVEEPVEVIPVEPIVEDLDDRSCTELTLSQEELILDEPGGHVFLTALPTPLDCEDEVRYTSLDETVATVDDGGMITAVAPGETEILVTCGKVSQVCLVICDFVVEEPEEETPAEEEPEPEEAPAEEEPEVPQAQLELSSVDFTLFRPGEETVLTVKNAREDASITYASSDTTVATVSETGKVVAVGEGTATITVTVDGQVLTCVARCKLGATTENNENTEAAPADLQLSHTDAMLFRLGETFVLSLLGDGNKVSGAVFSSENAGVCTVNGNGLVTAAGSGTTNVNVTYGGKTYTCIVRCNF